MKTFKHSPVTVEIVDSTGDESSVWIGHSVSYGPMDGLSSPFTAAIDIRLDQKLIGIGEIVTDTPDLVEAVTSPNGYRMTVREMRPTDVIGSRSIDSQIPLPPIVAATMLSQEAGGGQVDVDPTLEALVDENGYVSTMMLSSSAGLFARYDRTWIEIKDLDSLDGLSAYSAKPEALDLYDQYDVVGQSIHVGSLPLEDGEEIALAPPPPAEEADSASTTNGEIEEALVAEDDEGASSDQASVETEGATLPFAASAQLPRIADLKSLLASIEAADSDHSIRWYVEKRARALGYEDALPWNGDS